MDHISIESEGKDELRLYGAHDLSELYGHTRQAWWEKMKKGKLKSQKTSSGYITTSYWLNEYFKNN